MLYVDFDLRLGHMWKNDKEGNLIEEYDIFYSPNALFAICDIEHNLISFAADEIHLKNSLGKSKGYHDNCYEGFNFTFTCFESNWFLKKNPTRIKQVLKTIVKTFTTGKITNYFVYTVVPSKD